MIIGVNTAQVGRVKTQAADQYPPEVLLGKDILKIGNKCTGVQPCRSVISIKLLCNFIEITLRHGCRPVNLLYI